MIYKTFQKVSNVCQVLDKSKYNPSQTINGVTFTNNGDGTFTANGTATANIDYRGVSYKAKRNMIIGHKYLTRGCPAGGSSNTYYINLPYLGRDYGNGVIAKLLRDISNYDVQIIIKAGTVCDNLVFKPQLFDLTEMYGAGNEPTTVEQFRQDFPEEMYDYSPHCFVKSYRTLLKASDYCQFIKPNLFYNPTSSGLTITNNGDTFTVNGTTTKKSTIGTEIKNWTPIIGHKILVSGCPEGGGANTFSLGAFNQRDAIDYGNGGIGRVITTGKWFGILFESGVTFNNLIFKPQLFDLTEMYGAGNEPTTVEQFRQDFPEEIYDYKPYSIIPSYKKSLVCKTKNLIPYPYMSTTLTKNGITFTDNGDGSITANGTATGNAPFYLFESSTSLMGLKAGSTYTISMEGSTTSCYLVANYYSDGSWHSGEFNSIRPSCFTKTIPSTWEGFQCYILVVPGATINNTVFKPMIELGSTATEYHPYGYL